jgi:hypothetical protein
MRIAVGALCALGLALALALDGSSVVSALVPPSCDYTTGAGYIFPDGLATGNKATFAIAGGCLNGSGLGTPPAPYWGHLLYRDKTVYAKLHSVSIDGYKIDDDIFPDPKGRIICGHGKSDDDDRDVDFIVRTKDSDDRGYNDEFDIQMTGAITYSTFPRGPHKLGGGTGGGGNMHHHKHDDHNSGGYGGKCPSMQKFDLAVTKTGNGAGFSTVTSVPLGINCGPTCTASFNSGMTVTLTATSNAGTAIAWTGGCDTFVDNPLGGMATCTVMMTAAKTVTVSFVFQE